MCQQKDNGYCKYLHQSTTPISLCIPTKQRSAITFMPLTSKVKEKHWSSASKQSVHEAQESSEVLWSPCFDRSEQFWLDKGDLDNITLLKSLVFWLSHTAATSQFSASLFSVHKPTALHQDYFHSQMTKKAFWWRRKRKWKSRKMVWKDVWVCTVVCVFVWVTFAYLTGLHVGPVYEIVCDRHVHLI